MENTQLSQNLQEFLEKNKEGLAKNLDKNKIKSTILKYNENDMKVAAQQIQAGNLVAFQTETVYGLGADAFNEEAVIKIYKTKNRPQSDPIIVHVTSQQQALELIEIDELTKSLFLYLSSKFWPGPLTMIMKANTKKIPLILTAQTGLVGLRHPSTKVSQDLINISQRPIAAPSANLFSHVSPSSAIHVFNDFYDQNVHIIEGDQCQFGIESTVIKITHKADFKNELSINILRNGSVSYQQLQTVVQSNETFKNIVEIQKQVKEISQNIQQNSEAPGQLLKHYSPYCKTFLLEIDTQNTLLQNEDQNQKYEKINDINLSNSVVIDFGQNLKVLEKQCLQYFTLSETQEMKEAMHNLYNLLRKAENLERVENILIFNIDQYFIIQKIQQKIQQNSQNQQQQQQQQSQTQQPEFFETVYDKLYRSSSGKKLIYNQQINQFFYLQK